MKANRRTVKSLQGHPIVSSIFFIIALSIVIVFGMSARPVSAFQKPVIYFEFEGITSRYNVPIGQEFDAKVMLAHVGGVDSVSLNITYATNTLEVVDSIPGMTGKNIAYNDNFDLIGRNEVYEGQIYFTGFAMTKTPPNDDPLQVATIRFKVIGNTGSFLHFIVDPDVYLPVKVMQVDGDKFNESIPTAVDSAISPNGDNVPPGIAIQPGEPYEFSPQSSPTVKDSTMIGLMLSESAEITVQIKDIGGKVVKTLADDVTSPGGMTSDAQDFLWDGSDDGNVPVPDGEYYMYVHAIDAFNNWATASLPVAKVDNTTPITTLSASKTVFSPYHEDVQINYSASESASASLRILNTSGKICSMLATQSQISNGSHTISWNGKDEFGNILPDGQYIVKFDAEDNAGNSAIPMQTTVQLQNIPPEFSDPEPKGILAGLSDEVSLKISVPVGGSPIAANSVKLLIDDQELTILSGPDTGQRYKVPPSTVLPQGVHRLSVNATDDNGRVWKYEWMLNIDTVPPIADAGGDKTIVEGNTAVFDASLSNDPAPGTGINKYFWDLDNDGIYEVSGKTAQKQYPQDGNYTAKLKVSDNAGHETSKTVNVQVDNLPPTVEAGPDIIVRYGNPVNFSGSYSDTGVLDSHTVTWNFGDSSAVSTTNPVEHTYTVQPGTYIATFKVTDDAGDSSTDNLVVLVQPRYLNLNLTVASRGQYSDILSMTAKLTDTEETTRDLSGKTIRFSFGNESLQVITNAQGEASVSTRIDQKPGSYVVSAVFEGDAEYSGSSSSDIFVIEKENVQLAVDNTPINVELWAANDGVPAPQKTLSYMLTDEDSERIDPIGAVQPLKFMLEHYPAALAMNPLEISPNETTTGSGLVTFQVPFETSGTYRLNLTSLSNNYYKTVEAVTVINITDTTPPAIVDISDRPDYFSPDGNGDKDTVTFTASVKEINSFTAIMTITCGALNMDCLSIHGTSSIDTYNKFLPLSGSMIPQNIQFIWDGKDDSNTLMPDGDYVYNLVVTDKEGNKDTEQGTVTLDNPPKVTVATQTIYFSPNSDGRKDFGVVKWSADQEGYFTFKIYDSNHNLIDVMQSDMSNAGHVNEIVQTAWDGLKNDGTHFEEGKYTIEITGRDAKSSTDNPCVPAKTNIVLDVTAPQVEKFYPIDDEFTWLKPKIKANITDNLAGFGETAEEAGQFIVFNINPGGLTLHANIKGWEPDSLSLRAWVQPDIELTRGPHYLSVLAEDRAGNVGNFSNLRFVAIEPFADDFSESSIDLTKWNVVPIKQGKLIPDATVVVNSGSLTLHHAHNQKDDGIPPADIYGVSLVSKGVYDVSRQEVVIEARNVTESGIADTLHGAGVALVGVTKSGYSTRLYLLRSGDTIMAFFEGDTYDQNAWLGTEQVTGSADLKIKYEEGIAGFYLNGQLIREFNITLQYAMAGIYALSGFSQGTNSSVDASMNDFWTDLAGPTVTDITLANAERPSNTDIIYNQEHYKLTATGTPWQKHVTGSVYNPLRLGQVGAVQNNLDKLTVGDPVSLEETVEGSGEYTADPILMDKSMDAEHNETNYIAPIAYNEWLDVSPIDAVTFKTKSTNYLSIITSAVQNVTLSNIDNPAGYAYIAAGEKYLVQATTRTGDWNIKLYILNLGTLLGGGPTAYQDALVAGPFTMTKTRDGLYEMQNTLTNLRDSKGATSTYIVPWVVYGFRDSENRLGSNRLQVGEPQIRYASIINAANPAIQEIAPGETVAITVRAMSGQSLTGYLINPDNMTASNGGLVVGNGFPLIESPTGLYTANVQLLTNTDNSMKLMTRLKALVIPTGANSPIVISYNELALRSRVQLTGTLFPQSIVRFQEPLFNYKIQNLDGQPVSGTLTGIIVSNTYQIGDPVFASFTNGVNNLSSGTYQSETAQFTPVDAQPNTYPLIVYFQPSGSNIKEQVFTTHVNLNMCQ